MTKVSPKVDIVNGNPVFSFSKGHHYLIRDTGNLEKTSKNEAETFIYVEKAGRHHCFTNLTGGWGRTYTDAQLIGKHITEVQS